MIIWSKDSIPAGSRRAFDSWLEWQLDQARDKALEEGAAALDALNGWGKDKGRGGHAAHFAAVLRGLKSQPVSLDAVKKEVPT